jgi:glutathione S-transferase
MLKVWGRTTSINVQKVLWCLAETGTPYERIDAGLAFGKNTEDWYRKMNPNGLVPTIDDDGFVLWESNAIVRYLAAKYGAGSLCPADAEARADADRWMEWHSTSAWGTALRIAFFNLYRVAPEKRDQKAVDAAIQQSIQYFTLLDSHLAGRRFITGDALTMGDIPMGCATHRFLNMDFVRPSLPSLEAWYARLLERPGYKAHVALPLS